MGANGQYITAFPAYKLLVHKVNIDQDPSRKVSEPTYMTILDLVLDAKCDKGLQVEARRSGISEPLAVRSSIAIALN